MLAGGSSVAQVYLAGVHVSSIDSQQNDVVVITAARGNATLGDVLLVADTGATVTAIDAWTQLVEGNIASVTV